MTEHKTKFAALPLRAIGDTELSSLELRVLACIAYHDRMSNSRGKGQGAWASNMSMAKRVGCHHTNVSSAITTLAKRGYISRERHHFDKRKHVFRVLYDGDDSLPDDKPTGEIVGQSTNEIGKVVCPVFEKSEQSQSDAEGKYIPLSGERYFSEESERYSSEEARRVASRRLAVKEPRSGIGATLAQFERGMKSGDYDHDLSGSITWLLQVQGHAIERGDDNTANWALRLASDCDQRIELIEWERTPIEAEAA